MNVLVSPSAAIPSFDIGLRRPLSALARTGEIDVRFRVSGQVTADDVAWADSVIFCRNQEPHDLQVLEAALGSGKSVIYDIDDNFLHIPLTTAEGRFHRDPVRLYILRQMVSLAKITRTYSPRLAEALNIWRSDIQLRKCNIDAGIVNGVQRIRRESGSPVLIAYASARVDSPSLLEMLEEVVIRACENFGPSVRFVFWKQLSKRLSAQAGVEVRASRSSYDAFLRELYSSAFDIGLAPALDTQFFNSKTNTKYRDYGLCRIPSIYSDTELYRGTVTNGVTGLLTDNDAADWIRALDRLIHDAPFRTKIGLAAEQDVRNRFSMDGAVEEWRYDLGLANDGRGE